MGELRCGHQGDSHGLRTRRQRLGGPRARFRRKNSSSPAGTRRLVAGIPAQPYGRFRCRAATRSTRFSQAPFVAAVGPRRAATLVRPAPSSGRGPAGLDVNTISPVVGEVIRRAGTPPFFMGLAAPVGGRSVSERRLRPDGVEPDRILQRLDHPSRRYLVHLNAPG